MCEFQNNDRRKEKSPGDACCLSFGRFIDVRGECEANGFAETHFNKLAVISWLRIQIAVLISESVKWWSLMAR